MRESVVVAIAGGVAGWLIGLLAAHVTGWRWWIRICVAIAPAIALLIAERKCFVRTAEELNRPIGIFAEERFDATRKLSELARRHGLALSVGLGEKERDIVYNMQVLVGPDGHIGKQRKLHLSLDEVNHPR